MAKFFDPKNDVVFTPDYVADLMCKLANVNTDSVVFDNTAGAGALLHAAARAGAKAVIGVEVDYDVNTLLLDNPPDCTQYARLICGDGMNLDNIDLSDANVFLSNPPYSFPGKGLCFAKAALAKMKQGRAVILIMETAGSDKKYTKELLENNTLISSIKMPDIFKGGANVSVVIYTLDIGMPHDFAKPVTFVDFTNDGLTRSGRKTQKGTVKNGGDARERYNELFDILDGKRDGLTYFSECVIDDPISPEGGDWNYFNHKKYDLIPTEEDFKRTVANYLSWKVGAIMRGEISVDSLK